ncbi:MAG: GTPase ObgE [Chloroflexi bacterium]|nr:GTPase ObgE [Chloroflexota bacterium]
MFDHGSITVKGGNGGNGVVSFRREKFVPFGGPDGGDGGNGGNVVLEAAPAITDLRAFRSHGVYRAEDGKNGRGKKQHGKNGADLDLKVPVGTVVLKKESVGEGGVIADLWEPGQLAVIARGGKGGRGNVRFATSTQQAPRIAERGEAGEEAAVILELRLIADVGIIGYPNVGKSSLLAAVSAAQPKVAAYPFTTREPVLGMVESGEKRFVMAEIPGLIAGAHLGRGLGHEFLRHAMRTRVFLHLIDGTSASPVEDMIQVNNEISLFDSALGQKPQMVAVNKIDLSEVRASLQSIRQAFREASVNVFFVSAATGEGLSELMTEMGRMLRAIAPVETPAEAVPQKVFRPQPRRRRFTINREDNAFVIAVPELERIVAGTPDATMALGQLRARLDRIGVRKALEKAGIKPGDRVRCGDFEWLWE